MNYVISLLCTVSFCVATLIMYLCIVAVFFVRFLKGCRGEALGC